MKLKHGLTYGLLILCLLTGNVFTTSPVRAADWGEATAPVLNLQAGAVLPARGGAGQSTVRGPEALHYNPAGLSKENAAEFTISYQQMVEDITYGTFDYLGPDPGNSNWAIGLSYLDYGSVESSNFKAGGNELLETTGSFNDVDVVFSGAYGGRITENLNWGLAARGFNLELESTTASGVSADGGIQWYSPDPELPLTAGITVQNLGPNVEFEEKSEKLPLLFKAGGSLGLEKYIGYNSHVYGDLEHHVHESNIFPRLGAEWRSHNEFLSLRLGYDASLDVDNGVTFGFGLYSTVNDLGFDYALVPFGNFGYQHRFSLTWQLQ